MSEISLKFTPSDFVKVKITSSKDAYEVARKFYHDDLHIYESFFILLLNRSNNTIGYAKISQGGVSGTVVDVKIIAKYCVDSLACSLVIFHNHPSGNPSPSENDKEITEKINKAVAMVDCKLLDHIILAGDTYLSLADEGLFF